MLGNVILLNGCSSAGKTTLAKEIQSISPEPYHYIALDQFRDGLPPSLRGLNSLNTDPGSRGLNVVPVIKNGRRLTKVEFGDFGRLVLSKMRRMVAQLAKEGCSVVVDDIIFEKDFLLDYAKVLNPEKSWLVAVRCDLETVKSRESTRLGRFPGTAESHYELIHQHGNSYDINVDTSSKGPRHVAEEVLSGLENHPTALSNLLKD